MLARFDERAPEYDRENRFFDEDFAELRESGYLSCALPAEYGGAGLGLHGYTQLARRLGYVAPATALAVNMHVYWTGLAADLLKMGDESCRFILEQAADGAVFAAIHGEPGNDMPLLLSTTTAERVDGGWEISGHKIFGSLTPVWTYGGFHAMDTSDPADPRIVHGFLPRDTPGIEIVDTWDTLGMRATQSQDTVLDKAFCPDELCPVVCPAGFAGAGPFHVGIFAWALTGFAAVYHGAGTPRLRHHAGQDADADVDRPHPLDGPPPRGAAPRGQDAHGLRRRRRAARPHGGRLGGRRPARGLAGAPRRHPSGRDQRRRTTSSTGRSTCPAAPAPSAPTGSSSCSATSGWAASTPGNRLLAPELIGKLCLGVDPDSPQRWG